MISPFPNCGGFGSLCAMKIPSLRIPAFAILSSAFLVSAAPVAMSQEKLKVLLVDGQNNHAWAETTPVMVDILEKSGRFEVTVSTSAA